MTVLQDETTSRFVQVSEGEVNMRLHLNDAGEGPVVVMIHGGGPGASGWSNYYRNIDSFVDAGFRVLLIDCPGFGQSGPMVTATALDIVNAQGLYGLLRELGIAKVHLVGNSMGGATAIRFTLDHPEMVDRLVLMGPAGMGGSVFIPMPAEGIKMLLNLYRDPSPESLDNMLSVFVHDSSKITQELRDARFRNMMRNNAEHMKNFVESANLFRGARMSDLSGRLGEIKVKTLITQGVHDRMVPMDHGLKLVTGIHDSRLVVFNRCGHWVQWEHAEEFNRIVIDFLKSDD